MFRECIPGEELFDNQCVDCTALFYSITINQSTCLPCMDHATCLGTNQVSVDSGYWRSTINSSNIYKCPRASSCLGGFYSNQSTPILCATGYTGILC